MVTLPVTARLRRQNLRPSLAEWPYVYLAMILSGFVAIKRLTSCIDHAVILIAFPLFASNRIQYE